MVIATTPVANAMGNGFLSPGQRPGHSVGRFLLDVLCANEHSAEWFVVIVCVNNGLKAQWFP